MYINKKVFILILFEVFFLYFTISPPVLAIQTALGDIRTEPGGLVNDILKIGINAAGGVSFLLMLYGSFLFLTSGGDENKLHEATEVITSAIAGLLVIIFSVFLLQLIGEKILWIF